MSDVIVEKQSYTSEVWGQIEDFVSATFPFDLRKIFALRDMYWLRPDKPDDGICGFVAFEANEERTKPRLKIRTGRFLTRKLSLTYIPDAELRVLADGINALLFPDEKEDDITFLVGEEIRDAYRKAVGSRSCMTGENCRCVGLYVDNPDRFRLMVARDQHDSARAIVSQLDDGRFLLDRVYSSSHTVKQKLVNVAVKSGFLLRANRDAETWIVSGLSYNDGEVPYMDTLNRGDICIGKLTISTVGGSFGLNSTDGYIPQGEECAECGDRIDEEDGE